MVYSLFIMLLQTPALSPAPAPAESPAAPPVYGYVPILVMAIVATLVPVGLLGLSRLLNKKVDEKRASDEEAGVESASGSVTPPSSKFFIPVMLFVIFSVETVLLFPWAVIYDQLALFGLFEMLIFVGILVVGYYYAWSKGAFDWA